MPVEKIHGRAIAASFVVGGVMLPEEIDGLESLSMLGDLAKGGRPVQVGGDIGARTERVAGGAAPKGECGQSPGRLHVPGTCDGRRWLVVTFSTPGEGAPNDQVANALVQLFDTMMTTFRWRR